MTKKRGDCMKLINDKHKMLITGGLCSCIWNRLVTINLPYVIPEPQYNGHAPYIKSGLNLYESSFWIEINLGLVTNDATCRNALRENENYKYLTCIPSS